MQRVLGIDPGIASTGWGIVDAEGGRLRAYCFGTISTNVDAPMDQRILDITDSVKQVIEEYSPSCLSIEDIFFLRNVSSAIPIAKVIGSLQYLASLQQISYACYTPLQIKLAVTGMGKATKKQVEHMISFMLGLQEGRAMNHASDALAAAVCHIHTREGTRGLHQ